MRCKNCGTYNDDNRYICETCGSPLYDEEEIAEDSVGNADSAPQLNTPQKPLYQEVKPSAQSAQYQQESSEKNPAEKKSIIVIAILAVVLIAVIASVAVVAHSKSKSNETTTSEISASQTTAEHSTVPKTKRTTQPDTTEETTTTTTTTTTTATTQAEIWYINVNTSGGGTVKGGGEYKNGEKVTITAKGNGEYTFDGWYSDGIKVSSSAKYTFIANGNMNFTAIFINSTTEPATDNEIENGEIEDMNFGG